MEWKTRGHDHAPGLHEALLSNGFTADEPESIMIGEARALAFDVPLPAGVRLRRISAEADVRAMCAMVGAVFGDPDSDDQADALLRRLTINDGMVLGSPRVRDGSSARADWSRLVTASSLGSGVGPPGPSGAAWGSIAR